MATIDSNVYVALGNVVGLKDDADSIVELHSALMAEAKQATAITILGGYFNKDYIVNFLGNVPRSRRRDVEVKIAIGIEPGRSTVLQWDELRALLAALRKGGFRQVTVKAVQNRRHFHTKLNYFLRSTQPSWYVGSANPTGSDRHEMMVRIGRKHPALSAYAQAVWEAARDVVHADAKVEIRTPLAFFASGFVVYRPPVIQLFTFDAFRFKPEERRLLEGDVGERINVPFASVTTEGYGFRLADALGESGVQAADSGDEAVLVRNVHYRNSSVETVFGYWMPEPYKLEIEDAVRGVEDERKRRMTDFVAQLADPAGTKRAREAFTEYGEGLNAFALSRNVTPRSLPDCHQRFNEFLNRRSALAHDPERIARHCRALVFTPMPDLSNDESAARNFQESFFEDVAARAGDRRRARVIKSIIEGLRRSPRDPWDPNEWVAVLKHRLSDEPWTDGDWIGQKEDVE